MSFIATPAFKGPLEETRAWRAAAHALDLTVSMAVAVVCLLAVRLPVVLSPVEACSGGLGRWIRRAPNLSALIVMAAGLAVCTSPLRGALPGTVGLLLLAAIAYVLLGVFRMAALAAQETPTTLAEIEATARNGLVERWFFRRIEHPIDAYFAGMIVSATVMGLVPAVLVVASPSFRWLGLAFVWVASVILNARHYTTLHVNSHNPIFRVSRANRASRSTTDRVILGSVGWVHEYIVNPVINVLPEFVAAMHVYNHHVEQNSLADVTTTLPYDRASFFDFCRLACRRGLLFVFPVALVPYLIRGGRRRELKRLVRGAVFFYAAIGALWFVDATLAAFLVAAVYARTVAIGGANALSEHPFVDLDAPENPYRNAILVLEDATDHGWFGEWLHAAHHVRPGRHWASVAVEGHRQIEQYRSHGAIGMKAFGRRAYLKALWTRRFDRLSEYILWVGQQDDLPQDQIVRVLEQRTRPWGRPPAAGAPRWQSLDVALGGAVAWALVADDGPDPVR
ncbi:MAG TPA: hypothetical protein VF469_13445 [Kofleriaceae bacterium]